MEQLFSEEGAAVSRLKLTPELLLNRSISLFGPSGSGKTYTTKHILDVLRGKADQIILVSPTEPSTNSFMNYVPQAMIHYNMTAPDPKFPNNPRKRLEGKKGILAFIQLVWNRQEMLTNIYRRANDLATLRALFERLPAKQRAQAKEGLQALEAAFADTKGKLEKSYRSRPGALAKELARLEETHAKAMGRAFKLYMWRNLERLWGMFGALDEAEQYALQYIDLNPNLVLIFDDCAAELKSVFRDSAMSRLFYQNRHVSITTIFTFQDDTDLVANLRKNSFISIFCSATVCRANFERAANNWPRETRALIEQFIPPIYKGATPHLKLVYLREDPRGTNFYYIRPEPPEERMFGSPAFLELCAAIGVPRGGIDTANPFFREFAVST